MDSVVGEDVHLRLSHLKVDLLAAKCQFVRLKFRTGKEALLRELAAPVQLFGGTLKFLVRKGDIRLALTLLFREVALLVLFKCHLGKVECDLPFKKVTFALALGDLKTLLRDDEVSVRCVRGNLLIVALLNKRSGVEFDKQIARLHAHAILNDPKDRVASFQLASEHHLVAALHRT